MGGAVVMIILLVVVVPAGVLIIGAVVASLLGSLLKRDVDAAHGKSELLGLSESNPWSSNGSREQIGPLGS